jgi:curved DNA-binding protein CbpA
VVPSAPNVPQVAPTPEQAPAAAASVAPPPSQRPLTAEQNALKTKILERAEQITSQDYFQMLGLERDASVEAVQKAFIGLAKVWHPDRLPGALVDVKDACSKVFTHLTEAHATLIDPSKRKDYMTLLKDGGATPDDQAKIQAILEAATEFQKAEFLLKRNLGDPQAYEMVKRCVSLDPEQPDYMATLTWLDAQKPEWLSREKTLEKVLILDRCVQKNANCERAYFYRGMLHKRADVPAKALKDFKKASELNPRNLDAAREVRLHNMRGGATKPPPGLGGATTPSKPPPTETLGGLFGKLFKK